MVSGRGKPVVFSRSGSACTQTPARASAPLQGCWEALHVSLKRLGEKRNHYFPPVNDKKDQDRPAQNLTEK